MIRGFKYVFKNKCNIISILTHIGAPCEIAGEQPKAYGTHQTITRRSFNNRDLDNTHPRSWERGWTIHRSRERLGRVDSGETTACQE